jgi:succinate dehydrogenase hydrophobic anchor subunit
LDAIDHKLRRKRQSVIELFEAVEVVAGNAHNFAGLRDVAQHFGEVEDTEFVLDVLVYLL